jgi:hypothetical protein
MITAPLPPSRPAPARPRHARSPNYPGPSRCCLLQQHAVARNLCPRTLLTSVTPVVRCQRCPAVGRPRRTQPPCGRDRSRCRHPVVPGHPARLWPSSPQPAGHVNIRRTPPPSPRISQRTCRFERRRQPAPPPGSTLPLSRASPGLSGASAPATYPPYGCRLPAGLTECDGIGIGDSGRAPGARVKGLDHWSSMPGAASGRPRRRGSGARAPASGAGWAVFDKPRIAGSVRASKHGANKGTNRTHKK